MSDVRTSLENLLGASNVVPLSSQRFDEIPMACPADDEQAVETLRLAASEGWKLLPLGLGSKLSWRQPDKGVDFALSTRRITGIVAYEPGDGTLSARAGTTMAELERVAREGKNHLTPRVAAPDRATLGGVLAAGQSGIDRSHYGPSRHHVLGMRVALADGSFAKSGGRLVKNVTGYDMHRLYCGSHGSLCVILEASMRLFAGFEREILLTAPARDREHAIEAACAAGSLGLQPLAIRAENVLDPGGSWRVHVLLAGRAAVVEWARGVVLDAWPEAAEGVESIERLRDAELFPDRGAEIRCTGRPSRLPAAIRRLPVETRMIVEPSIALAVLFAEKTRVETTASGLREAGLASQVIGSGASPAVAPGAHSDLLRRLKLAFDPGGILAGGPVSAPS
jgi:FAD/FMN-containing dehydrogenase